MPNAGDYVRAGDTTRYYTKGVANTVQSIPNNAFTIITFDGTDEVDTLGIHDPSTNNSRFNIGLKLGFWWCIAKYATAGNNSYAAANNVEQVRSRFLVNGTTSVNGSYSAAPAWQISAGTVTYAGFWTSESQTLVQASASADYVELQGLQTSGGALNTVVSGDLRCQFICIYLGP